MATTNYQININTTGATNSINNLQSSMNGLGATANSVGAALAAMVSVNTVKDIASILDASTNLQNRLQGVTAEGQTSKDVMNLLAQSAQNLGVSLNDLGNSYASIANATKDLGYSQQTNIMLNDTLTKSLLINGATQQQVNSAYYQFGQIMAKGKSEGDDFNSMLEAAPGIIRNMSDQLGVTTGALRYMSSQGKLTADVWKKAMEGSADAVDKAFKDRIPTIGQSIEKLKNTMSLSFTGLDAKFQISKHAELAILKITNSILELGNSFDEMANSKTVAFFKLVAAAALLAAGFTVIGRVVSLVVAGWGVLTTALATVSGWFVTLATYLGVTNAVLAGMIARLAAFVGGLLALLGIDLSGVKDQFKGLSDAWDTLFNKDSSGANKKILSLDEQLAEENKKLMKALGLTDLSADTSQGPTSDKKTEKDLKNADAVKKALQGLSQAYKDYAASAQASIETIGKTRNEVELINAKKDAYKTYYADVLKLRDEYMKNDSNLSASDAEKKAINELSGEYNKQLGIISELNAQKQQAVNADILKESLKDLGQAYSDTIRNMKSEIGSIGLFGSQGDAFAVQKQAADEFYSAMRKLQEEFKQNGTAGTEAEREAIDKLTQSYQAQVEQLKILNAEKEKAIRAQELLKFQIEQSINVEDELMGIQNEMARSTMTELEKKYNDIDQAALKSAQNAIRAEQARRGEMDATGKAFKQLSPSEVKAYYDAATKGSQQLRAEMKRQYDESRTWSTGWKQAFNEYVDNATNAANQAKSLFTKFTSGLEDALVGLAKTGKFSWKELLSSMAEDLLRSQIKQTLAGILGLITGQGSGGSGGILGAIGSIFGLGGSTGAGATGKSKTDPLYVYDVSSGGSILGGGTGGTDTTGGGIFGPLGKAIGSIFGSDSSTTDTSKTGDSSILSDIGKAIGSGLSTVGDAIGTVTGGVVDAVKTIGSGIGTVATTIGTGVVDAVSSSVDWLSGVGDLFSGLFATGGNISSGKFGIVGEKGPEIVSGPASVFSNRDSWDMMNSGRGSSQNVSVTYNINAVDARSFKELLAQDPSYLYALTQQGARNRGFA